MTAGWDDRWAAAARALEREHREHMGALQHANIILAENPDNDYNYDSLENQSMF